MLLIYIGLALHPFHVSVTEIKYKEEEKAIQISSRIFLDDLELGLQAYTGNEKLDITLEENWDFINENLEPYLLERIKLWDEKGRAYEIDYVGAEIEEDVLWAYLEIEKIKKLKKVKVQNAVLHEVWGDQENLIHFRAFEKVKSARFYKGEDTDFFDWID